MKKSQRRRIEKRGGNDAPWKAWKTQNASFPLFPPGLEIRQKAPDLHISTAPTAGLTLKKDKTKDAAQSEFQLTDAGHFRHDNTASVASLRSRPECRRNEWPGSNRNHCPPSSESAPSVLNDW